MLGGRASRGRQGAKPSPAADGSCYEDGLASSAGRVGTAVVSMAAVEVEGGRREGLLEALERLAGCLICYRHCLAAKVGWLHSASDGVCCHRVTTLQLLAASGPGWPARQGPQRTTQGGGGGSGPYTVLVLLVLLG